MALGGGKKKALVLLAIAPLVGLMVWALPIFTNLSFDPRVSQIKAAAVDLLTREQRLGVVSPQLAAKLTNPSLSKDQVEALIQATTKAKGAEYRRIFTPRRAARYQRLTVGGLRLWLQDSSMRWVVSNEKLQVHYWQEVRITKFGAWVKVRGQFSGIANGLARSNPAATYYLRMVGNPQEGYKISNEKWLGYNPS